MMKPSKYKNKWCTHRDGTKFQSKAEMRRYDELLLLQKAGEITKLKCQPRFDLLVPNLMQSGALTRKIGFYKADFEYIDTDGKRTIEDVKSPYGKKEMYYRLKKRMVEATYHIVVTEVIYK